MRRRPPRPIIPPHVSHTFTCTGHGTHGLPWLRKNHAAEPHPHREARQAHRGHRERIRRSRRRPPAGHRRRRRAVRDQQRLHLLHGARRPDPHPRPAHEAPRHASTTSSSRPPAWPIPGPVAQTFFLDDELKNQFALDAIVTMVDAKHFEQHVDELNEPAEQVAFADLVLLNKTDLVDAAALERIESRIRGINGTAKIHRTKNADVRHRQGAERRRLRPAARAARSTSAFLEPEYPFEWGGVYQLTRRRLSTQDGRRARSSCASRAWP